MNETYDMSLASNKVFTLIVVLAIYWVATLVSLKGMDWVGKISKWGGMIGTIIPAGLLILLGIIYISTGGHNYMDMSQGFFPDLTNFDNLVLASSIFLFYAGMEMMGIHVMDVKNPSRNYPKAIVIGSLVTVLIFVLGTFSLGFIIPAKDINLTQSLLIGFDNYFHYLRISWLRRLSPSPDVRRTGRRTDLGIGSVERYFRRGQSRLPASVLSEEQQERRTAQYPAHSGRRGNAAGAAVRRNAFGTVVLPDPLAAHRTALPDHVHADVLAAIVLRYKMKGTARPFRLGKKGNGLMWTIGTVGFCGALLAFILSFVPPSQISVGSNTVWFSVLIIGCVVVVGAPFVIYAMRKPRGKTRRRLRNSHPSIGK